ncbi:hypothetical protein BYT27DRAFT_6710540 [Phlegmacium glaucopus]|nr:hypothetical protein BYT27DRAFT_6710540 [Phlegmacium glaucopus]
MPVSGSTRKKMSFAGSEKKNNGIFHAFHSRLWHDAGAFRIIKMLLYHAVVSIFYVYTHYIWISLPDSFWSFHSFLGFPGFPSHGSLAVAGFQEMDVGRQMSRFRGFQWFPFLLY